MLNGLALFSGIEGISVALAPWVQPVAYCDLEKYPRSVLLDRQVAGEIPVAPVWSDIRTLRAEYIPAPIDIIYGGFPCQDLSIAGTGAGLEGKRSGLVFDALRLVGECRPRFLFLENVPALSFRGIDRLLLELHALGFDARWTIVSAAEMGAPHLRERIWIVAHARGESVRVESNGQPWSEGPTFAEPNGETPSHSARHGREQGRPEPAQRGLSALGGAWFGIADTTGQGLQRWIDAQAAWQTFALGGGGGGGEWPHWLPEPSLCRGDDGLRHRVERLKALGNAVVPQTAREAFKRLIGIGG